MKFQRFLSVELNVQGCFVIQLSSFALLLSHQQLVYIITVIRACQEFFKFFFRFSFENQSLMRDEDYINTDDIIRQGLF